MLGLGKQEKQKSKNRHLYDAISSGDLARAEELLQAGADIHDLERLYSYAGSLCHEKASPQRALSEIQDKDTYISMIRLMLAHGFDVNDTSQESYTLLHEACRDPDYYYAKNVARWGEDVIPFLINEGHADASRKGAEHDLPIDIAISQKQENKAVLLAQYTLPDKNTRAWRVCRAISNGFSVSGIRAIAGDNLLDLGQDECQSILHEAVESGSREVLSYLMKDQGFDKVPFLPKSLTAAVYKKKIDMAMDLLAAGAPVTSEALYYAIYHVHDRLDLIENMIETARKAGNLPDLDLNDKLRLALNNTYAEGLFDLLIHEGADVNARFENGKTLLMIAAEDGNLKAAEFLCRRGARLEDIDDDGFMAHHYATIGRRYAGREDEYGDRNQSAIDRYRKVQDFFGVSPTAPEVDPSVTAGYKLINAQSVCFDEGDGLSMTFNFAMKHVLYRDSTTPLAPPVIRDFNKIQGAEGIRHAYNALVALGGKPQALDMNDLPLRVIKLTKKIGGENHGHV